MEWAAIAACCPHGVWRDADNRLVVTVGALWLSSFGMLLVELQPLRTCWWHCVEQTPRPLQGLASSASTRRLRRVCKKWHDQVVLVGAVPLAPRGFQEHCARNLALGMSHWILSCVQPLHGDLPVWGRYGRSGGVLDPTQDPLANVTVACATASPVPHACAPGALAHGEEQPAFRVVIEESTGRFLWEARARCGVWLAPLHSPSTCLLLETFGGVKPRIHVRFGVVSTREAKCFDSGLYCSGPSRSFNPSVAVRVVPFSGPLAGSLEPRGHGAVRGVQLCHDLRPRLRL